MSRPHIIPLVFWMMALSYPLVPGRAMAECDTAMLSVRVDSILASETGAEIDARLGAETPRLQALFDYASYRLLRTDQADAACGEEVMFPLPAGRFLHVRPLATHRNLVALELTLFAGARALMRTQLKILRGGLLVLVGSQSPRDAHITIITVLAPASWPGAEPFATGSPLGAHQLR
jgi:hypothetical protein